MFGLTKFIAVPGSRSIMDYSDLYEDSISSISSFLPSYILPISSFGAGVVIVVILFIPIIFAGPGEGVELV